MRHIVIPIARNSCCNFSLRYSCQTDIYNFFFSGLQRTVLVSARRPSPMYKNPVWIWVKISLQVTCELLLFSELKNFASISHLGTHRQLTIFFTVIYRSMRATIIDIFAILSLFSVAIHAAPPSARYAQLPECPLHPVIGMGLGPACSPRPTWCWKP